VRGNLLQREVPIVSTKMEATQKEVQRFLQTYK